MAELKTTIELYDKFTAPMMDIIQAVTTGEVVLQHLQSVMSQEIDTSTMMDLQNTIHQTTDATEALTDSLQNLSLSSPAMEGPDLKNVQQYQTKLEEAASALQQISSIQETIQNQSETLSILPENIQERLTTVNHSIEQMKANLSYIKQNPFDLDIETAKLEIDSFHDSVLKLLNSQSQLQNAIQHITIPNPNNEEQVIPVPIKPTLPDPLVENPSPLKAPIQPHAPPEPVEVPIVWKADTVEVFTGSGVERFQQEVQSANAMLEQLSNTQNSIAQQAFNTNLFPPQAFQDLNSLAVRMDMVRERIQQIENNPLNMGTNTANQELEQLRSQLNQAVQEQSQLNTAIKDMDIQTANGAYLRLSQTISHTEKYIRDNIDEQGRFNREISEGVKEAEKLPSAIKGAVAAYASIQSIVKIINLSDTMTQTNARLNLMVDVDAGESIEGLQEKIYTSAQNARGAYQTTADAVAKLGNNAGSAFSSNDEIIAFVEQLNKSFVIAGTEASGIDAAMLQLTQAMGSGVLRGEEYNSVLEQAPNIVQNIAKYIEENEDVLSAVAARMGMKVEDLSGNVEKYLKDIASEGIISAEMVKAALFYAAEETNENFESMPMTWNQIWTSFKNDSLMAFQPVLQKINDLANNEEIQGFIDRITESLFVLSDIALAIFDGIGQAAGFISNNWSIISPIIYGIAAAILYYTIATKGAALATKLATLATQMWSKAQAIFNAIIGANPLTKIILAIIIIISVIYAVVAAINRGKSEATSAAGVIMGCIAFVGAALWNTVVGVINAILQFLWTMFIEPWIGIIEWVLNVFQGGFDSFGDAVLNLLGQIISWFLSLGKVVTKIIDAIFGTSWTDGLSALQDDVLAWGKNNDAITLDRNAPMLLHRIDYDDSYKAGEDFGIELENKLSDLFSSQEEEKEDENPTDYEEMLENLGNVTENISGNTEKMADNMEITKEDLKYLRDIAEQETINRFTTAEIKIDMSGMQNTVKQGDLDGFLSELTDAVDEAAQNMAEGVYE